MDPFSAAIAVLLASAGAGAVAVGGWISDRLRSNRRNAEGECAACARGWAEIEDLERFLIQGRLVCQDCAARARRRLGWQFGLLGAAALLSSVGVLLSEDPAIMALLPPATVGIFAAGTVTMMKLANRRAQARLARGDDAFLPLGEEEVDLASGREPELLGGAE